MTTLTRADWEQRAQQLKIEGRAFINGEYTDAASGETFDCLSPVDGRFLAKVASCDLADANRAVENARATFNSGVWSQLAPAKRKAKLIRFADLLRKNVEELALLETLDMGKPIGDSSSIDVRARRKPFTGPPKPSTKSTTKSHRPHTTSLAW
jgi:gamma-glutamyl-gamma-aminobutyraldehyde dehydrogenase